jgi:hypothetical protein
VSLQVGVPVEQSSEPAWQGLVGAQLAPAAQSRHAPALQTLPEPQAVPLGRSFPLSWQVGVPVEQSSEPPWQGLAGVQLVPARQSLHVPAWQTLPMPQEAPSSRLVP